MEVEQNFDAWGRRRDPTRWDYISVPTPPDWLYRGYTGHEHLDPFVLINMNGRIYDPVVARVLSPDNFVQDPFSTQGYNRYSYGYNNPLKYTDPDGNNPLLGALIGGLGYFLSVAFSKNGFDNWNWGQFASSVALGALTGGIGAELATATASLGPVASGAISGAVSGAVAGGFGSAFAGGDFGRGAWQGGLFGAGIGLLTPTENAYPLLASAREDPIYSGNNALLPYVEVRAKSFFTLFGEPVRANFLAALATGQLSPQPYNFRKQRLSGGNIDQDLTLVAMAIPFFPKGTGYTPRIAASSVTAKSASSILKFAGNEAVEHFEAHVDQIMRITGKSAYNLKNYIDDANWIIQNGTFLPSRNAYVYYMGNSARNGRSYFGFVGVNKGATRITTFHIKGANELGF